MGIEIKGIEKRFGTFAAIDHVDLSIRSGELLALLGEELTVAASGVNSGAVERVNDARDHTRSEEHTSELQSH